MLSLLFITLFAVVDTIHAQQTSTTTKSTTTSFLLPPVSTGQAQNIWASALRTRDSTTEYLLACQTAWATPSKCAGDFTGVTYALSSSSLSIAIAQQTYECGILDNEAQCTNGTRSDVEDFTLEEREMEEWMTRVTVVDFATTTSGSSGGKKTNSAGKACKRDTKKKKEKGGSSSDDDDGNCSAGGRMKSLGVGAVGGILGVFLGVAVLL